MTHAIKSFVTIDHKITGAIIYRSESAMTVRGAVVEAAGNGISLRCANLRGADLRGADLGDASLRDADLRGANLRDAALSGADLRCARNVSAVRGGGE